MAKFKDREEYERWKAERLKEAALKAAASESPEAAGPQKSPDRSIKPPKEGIPDLGELFHRTWDVYKRRFGVLIALCLLSIVLFVLPAAVLAGAGFLLSLLLPDLKAILLGAFTVSGIVISLITGFWGMAALLCAITDESLAIRDALFKGWGRVGGFMWLLTLLGFLTTGGFLLLFIPGVIFTVWFMFGQFILIEDDERGMRALLKSKQFVKGYGFDVFVRLSVIWLVSTALGIIPFVGPILSLLFVPFFMIFTYLIYSDLKTLKVGMAFAASSGDKFKWIGTAALGYILAPVLVILLFGATLLASLPLLAGMMSSQGINIFAPVLPPSGSDAPQSSGVEPQSMSQGGAPVYDDEETRAARATFKRCTEAYRSGNIEETKNCFSRATLADMERSGQVEMAMGMIGGINIDELTAERQGSRITFKRSEKQGDATMSMSFTMVREDNQWKLGN